MCFISKKKLAKLQSSVDELTHIVKTNELTRLREESKKLKEIQALLSKVRFKVKDVKTIETDELGRVDVRITYQLPTVTLKIDDEGKPLKDDFFYSVNMLDMVSVEDLEKIQKVLREVKDNS